MSFAIADHKDTSARWEDLRSERKKKRKRGGDLNKKTASKVSDNDFSLARFIFELASKLFLAGVVFYICYASYNFLTTDSRFQITDVSLNGNHALSKNQLLEWMGPIQGENLFMYDLSEASEKLAEHPWVLSASVQRRFPQEIQIELIERVPYARIKFEKIFLMDNFGVILSEEKPEHQHLPLIAHTSRASKPENFSGETVIQGLKTMHYFNKLSFFKKNPLDAAELKGHSRIIFFTRASDLQIQMSMEMLSEGFKKFMIVLDTLENEADTIQMIDLSFKDQVVVRDRTLTHTKSMKTPTN
jgi:cell division protein FtsQ